MKVDMLVVGAGFAGSVIAQQLAISGKTVLVIDKRGHIGGNAYDEADTHGVLVHKYGPHIFHTNSKRIFNYLSQFTEWRPYEVRVLALVDEQFLPIPINRTTINKLYGLDLDEAGVAAFFDKVREPRAAISSSEDVVLNSVGRDLYDKFFRNYIRKQWGRDASELGAEVAARIPTRTNDDDRYFTDTYQGLPKEGYTVMFDNMLTHPNIHMELGVDFRVMQKKVDAKHIVYTGPIDEYFDCCLGKLPYRSLHFEFEHLPNIKQFQPVAVTSYPNNYEFTRITESKQLTGQNHRGTTLMREYPQADGDPYYPIPHVENTKLYKQYEELAKNETNVTFVGRLAQYRYYNMDQVVGAALKAAERILERNDE